jgi:hypothetical protein
MKLKIEDCRLRVEKALRRAWWYVRQVSGDAAYENYLFAARRPRGGAPLAALEDSCASDSAGPHTCFRSNKTMSREEFYLDALRRRYSGVSRCC